MALPEVRFTFRVLRSLDQASFTDGIPEEIRRHQWERLAKNGLDRIEHPLLSDAVKILEGSGKLTVHQAATKASGRMVWESRMVQGAGWRGAFILDDDGIGWIVYVERHDQFHANVAQVLKSSRVQEWMPRQLDYEIRERDVLRRRFRECQGRWATEVVGAVARAARTPGDPVVVGLERGMSDEGGDVVEMEVLVLGGDSCDVAWEQAHDHDALLEVRLMMGYRDDALLRGSVVAVLHAFSAGPVEAVYTVDGLGVSYILKVLYSELIAFEASVNLDERVGASFKPAKEPTHVHYVRQELIAESVFHGIALRALCGVWFVRQYGEDSGLPVCPECERRQPVAQTVLDALRSMS